MKIYKHKYKNQEGFSVVELLVVVAIIGILSAISLFYLLGHKKLYKADNQALGVVDMLQEARQKALSQRQTMRVEITDQYARLIDENEGDKTTDDVVLRKIKFNPTTEVVVTKRPGEILADKNPPEPITPNDASFVNRVYTAVGDTNTSEKVCTLRFQSNGRVVNAGTASNGNGAGPVSAVIHFWMPDPANNANSRIARAVTVTSTTGSIRMWEWDRQLTAANKWINSRK